MAFQNCTLTNRALLSWVGPKSEHLVVMSPFPSAYGHSSLHENFHVCILHPHVFIHIQLYFRPMKENSTVIYCSVYILLPLVKIRVIRDKKETRKKYLSDLGSITQTKNTFPFKPYPVWGIPLLLAKITLVSFIIELWGLRIHEEIIKRFLWVLGPFLCSDNSPCGWMIV